MSAEPTGFGAFAAELRSTNVVADPWFDGAPRFVAEPLVLDAAAARALDAAAEGIAEAHEQAVRIVLREPALLDASFGLSPVQKLMFLASGGRWHGVARADVFFVAGGGVRVCELNSDTPSGEPEAVALGRAAARPGFRDPNAGLVARFVDLIRASGAAIGRENPRVGIVYPTEMSEDLGMIRLYRDALAAAGLRVVLGAPFNLALGKDGGLRLFGEPVDVLFRHYKTDWWGEREPAYADADPPPDDAPLAEELAAVLAAEAAGRVAVVNPFGSVLTQNKRMLAFLWERRAELSASARDAVESALPPTFRLETCDRAELLRDRARWVLKSDYGCEGDEVVIGADVDDATWAATLAAARPGRWIAQEFFAPLRNAAGEAVNFGVYVVAGRAAGIFARAQSEATDVRARCAPVLVAEDGR